MAQIGIVLMNDTAQRKFNKVMYWNIPEIIGNRETSQLRCDCAAYLLCSPVRATVNNILLPLSLALTGAWKFVIRENSIAITLTTVATELLTCWFVRADCSTADEPGQVPQIGGLSNFGKVSTIKYAKLDNMQSWIIKLILQCLQRNKN